MNGFISAFPQDEQPFGIYIHIPFCLSRCVYCGFATTVFDPAQEEPYVNAVLKEMKLWASEGDLQAPFTPSQAETIYIGGGTPSILQAERLITLIEACKSRFRIAPNPEITVEINPATAGPDAFRKMRVAGINRASLGVQSFHDNELGLMGRPHTASEAVSTFQELREAGFDNISVDLIASFPGQSLDTLRISLQKVFELGPEHISVYLLEVKPSTPLERFLRRGDMPPIDEDLVADMYEQIVSLAQRAGYDQYEISNFAKPGRRSQHNLKYWTDGIFLGLGAAATGMNGRVRYVNIEDPTTYVAALNRATFPQASLTELTPETRFKDALIMGLRLVEGLDLGVLSERYRVDAEEFVMATIGDLAGEGLFTFDDDRLKLTPRGRLLSNVLFARWV
ncbi:MAG: radical SAM family heme chaperone HemW [Thermodesulfobacteriota bacterium]